MRDLVSDFRGLRGTKKQKKVVTAADLTDKRLNDMITDGNIDLVKVENLLKAIMRVKSRVIPQEIENLIRKRQSREFLIPILIVKIVRICRNVALDCIVHPVLIIVPVFTNG